MQILIYDNDTSMISQLDQLISDYFERNSLKKPDIIHFSSGEKFLSDTNTKVAVETKSGVYTALISDIISIEAQQHKVIVHTAAQDFLSIHKMQYWEDLLPKQQFFRSHRSFLVNFEHVTDFDHALIYLHNHAFTAYLARRKYTLFKTNYLLYLEGTHSR